ncbi:hypothetical protein [Sphingomicrobium arenosum]|uniref:hypothetical protein n=1 Tax=Sphingomicrobium arenosum TaxID=2233861 RepID=UPI00223F444B|nr:hypothetical protein [Sphingomicrobium arenosum]
MRLPDPTALQATLDRLAAALPGTIERADLLAPALLMGIALLHYLYYRRAMRRDGQQVVRLEDHTGPGTTDASMVDQRSGRAHAYASPSPTTTQLPCASKTAAPRRYRASVAIGEARIDAPVIALEDVSINGRARFASALKVGGDLLIRGEALFEGMVIVNGALRIDGRAHFARGLLVKGDTLAQGQMIIGTRDHAGWAVLRGLRLDHPLLLNGRVIRNLPSTPPSAPVRPLSSNAATPLRPSPTPHGSPTSKAA